MRNHFGNGNPLACLAMAGAAAAVSLTAGAAPIAIDITNPSFEQPATGKIDSSSEWATVPGWSAVFGGPEIDGTGTVDVGIDPNSSSWYTDTPHGSYNVYIESGEGYVYQTTGHTIADGDMFEMKVSANRIWNAATSLQMRLYYEDGGNMVPLATSVNYNSLPTGWWEDRTFTFTFNSATNPGGFVAAAVGKKLGVVIDNSSTTNDTWLGVDNVRLTVDATPVPEPTAVALAAMAGLGLLGRRRARR